MSDNPTKDESMSEQGIQFGDNLAWSHVESAKKINADLKELIAFLSK